MLSRPRDLTLKYHLIVEWPPSCRNRNVKTLKTRPDLVYRMNSHTEKLIKLAESYEHSVKIESGYNYLGIRMWFENGTDCYDFIMNQTKNSIKILPDLYVLSGLNNVLNKFKFSVDESGITIY